MKIIFYLTVNTDKPKFFVAFFQQVHSPPPFPVHIAWWVGGQQYVSSPLDLLKSAQIIQLLVHGSKLVDQHENRGRGEEAGGWGRTGNGGNLQINTCYLWRIHKKSTSHCKVSLDLCTPSFHMLCASFPLAEWFSWSVICQEYLEQLTQRISHK